MKTIVVSAVNLKTGGTLTILRDCLAYLSELAKAGDFQVIAIVYQKSLADFPGITYIETQWPKKRWINRLWYEYVSLKKVSRQIGPVYLWLSLHDTTPSVLAERRAVYCHNSFSFYRWTMHDVFFAPKIALFAVFTKLIYNTNIHANDYLIVQQQWFRKAMSEIFTIHPAKIIVAPPHAAALKVERAAAAPAPEVTFLFPGSPDSHKNFEIICKAADLLQNRDQLKNFKVFITVSGDENKYAQWLYANWGKLDTVAFLGILTKEVLYAYYERVSCLVFPSKVETWGLPITEFSAYSKPMLLADLPYAHETAAGHPQVAFFDPLDPESLALQMKKLITGDTSFLSPVPEQVIAEPQANSWPSLFAILLSDQN